MNVKNNSSIVAERKKTTVAKPVTSIKIEYTRYVYCDNNNRLTRRNGITSSGGSFKQKFLPVKNITSGLLRLLSIWVSVLTRLLNVTAWSYTCSNVTTRSDFWLEMHKTFGNRPGPQGGSLQSPPSSWIKRGHALRGRDKSGKKGDHPLPLIPGSATDYETN